jgi:hypothetical protein
MQFLQQPVKKIYSRVPWWLLSILSGRKKKTGKGAENKNGE